MRLEWIGYHEVEMAKLLTVVIEKELAKRGVPPIDKVKVQAMPSDLFGAYFAEERVIYVRRDIVDIVPLFVAALGHELGHHIWTHQFGGNAPDEVVEDFCDRFGIAFLREVAELCGFSEQEVESMVEFVERYF